MSNKNQKKSSKGWLKWAAPVFFLLCCFAYFPSFAGILFGLLGVVCLPLTPIKQLLNKYVPANKVLRGIIVFLVFIIICNLTPSTETPTQGTDTPDTTTSTTAPLVETGESNVVSDATDITSDDTTPPETTEQPEETTPVQPAIPTIPATEPPSEPTTEPTEPVISAGSSFSVRFIDVGQADAALVECDGHYMLIDGGNKADSNVIYTVLKKARVPKLDIVVGTHAHEDHIGGLPGAFNYTDAELTLCPVKSYDTNAFGALVKYANQNGGGITIPSVGDTYSLGSAIVQILGVNGGSGANNTSIVLRIDYGATSFLFTGDAEREAEQAILNSGVNLSATVLKVGHHGSDTSTTYPFLREIMPQYAVISVGEDNSYGHPTEDTLSRLRDADVTVFRTDLQGDIVCVSDGTTVTFEVERNADADTLAGAGAGSNQNTEPVVVPGEPDPEEEDTDYIGNKNTKKFHYDWCSSVDSMKESNKYYYTGTRDEMIAKGYDPCKRCDP